MGSLRLTRFTKINILKRIGRKLLDQFLCNFEKELASKNITLPNPTLNDDQYFKELASLFLSPGNLPEEIAEALHSIGEIASEHGQERLQDAIKEKGLNIVFNEDSSHEDIAMQVWLQDQKLFTEKYNEERLLKLSSFEYYPSIEKKKPSSFKLPDQNTLNKFIEALDEWFADRNRGKGNTRVEPYLIENEYWFLIRHGDSINRTPKIENQETHIMHYRPEKDDVLVYNPELNEIRINAGTKGERRLYRKMFGFHLFGREDYFSEQVIYTLEPLRELGKDALDVDGIQGIVIIKLTEIEIFKRGVLQLIEIKKAKDIFGLKFPIAASGKISRAAFEVTFEKSSKPRKVQIREPNILKLGRHCDANKVNFWISKCGFRVHATA